MTAFLLALVCLLFWGVGDFLAINLVRGIGAARTSVSLALVGIAIGLPYAAANFSLLAHFPPLLFCLNLLLGAVFVLSNLIYGHALRQGNAAVVTSIGASFTAWTALLASWVFSEQLSAMQWICVGIICVGIVLSTADPHGLEKRKFSLRSGILPALLATLGWTIYFTFIRLAIAEVGWFWPAYLSLLCFPILLLTEGMQRRKVTMRFERRELRLILICGILIRTAEFLYNAALRHGLTALVAPVAGSYPIIIVTLSFIFLGERLSRTQLAGVGLTLFAIVILGTTAS